MSQRPSPRYDAFLRSLTVLLDAERGRRAALATFLGVRPHIITEWLNGKQPTAEYLLGIQEWQMREEKKT